MDATLFKLSDYTSVPSSPSSSNKGPCNFFLGFGGGLGGTLPAELRPKLPVGDTKEALGEVTAQEALGETMGYSGAGAGGGECRGSNSSRG